MAILNFSWVSDLTIENTMLEFGKKNGHELRLNRLSWHAAWDEVIRNAIYRNPVDVSEIGSSWITDLRTMEALHAFTDEEISSLKLEDEFLPASVNNCTNPLDKKIYAIPWTTDTRFLYYRRDLLEKANIDPDTAFNTDEALKTTLHTLQEKGIPNPIAIPTRRSHMILHVIASWVWGNGSDFIDINTKTAILGQPGVIEAFCQYYDLRRFLMGETERLDDTESDAMFIHGNTAITISGPWLLHNQAMPPEVLANTGLSFPPGVPFIGGTNLILWQQSTEPASSIALIQYLASEEFQCAYFRDSGYLPSRLKVLTSDNSPSDSRFRLLAPRLKQGRIFETLPLWGWMEERLTNTLYQIWNEIFRSTHNNYHAIIEKRLVELERRINFKLQQ